MSYQIYNQSKNWSVIPTFINGECITSIVNVSDYVFSSERDYQLFLITDGKDVYKSVYDFNKKIGAFEKDEASRLLKEYSWYSKEDLQKYDPAIDCSGKGILYCLDKITNGRIYYDDPLKSHYLEDTFHTERFDVEVVRDTISVFYRGSLIAVYKRGIYNTYKGYKRSGPASQTRYDQDTMWTLVKIVDFKLKRNIEEELMDTFIKTFHLRLSQVRTNQGYVYEYPIKFRDKSEYVNSRRTKSKLNLFFYADSPEIIQAENVPKVIGRKFNVKKDWYQKSILKSVSKHTLDTSSSILDCKKLVEDVYGETFNRFNNEHYRTNKFLQSDIKAFTENVVLKQIKGLIENQVL